MGMDSPVWAAIQGMSRFLAFSAGMAKAMPSAMPRSSLSRRMKVLMPLTLPSGVLGGPPELPG